MVQRGRRTPLAKLEEKQAALKKQIKEARRLERLERAEIEKQRYLVLGRALSKALEHDDVLAASLEPLLNKQITKPKERKLIGLPPITDLPPAAGQ